MQQFFFHFLALGVMKASQMWQLCQVGLTLILKTVYKQHCLNKVGLLFFQQTFSIKSTAIHRRKFQPKHMIGAPFQMHLSKTNKQKKTTKQQSVWLNISDIFLFLWLSDILREFNPLVTGFSKGVGPETSPNAFLNQAVPGAKSGSVIFFTSSLLNAFNLLRYLQKPSSAEICWSRCAPLWTKWKAPL